MENKVLENSTTKRYMVQVGEHYVSHANVNSEGEVYEYNLSPKSKAYHYQYLDTALAIAKGLKGKVFVITKTKVVVENEEEVKLND